jgi:hypothetical protein
MDAQRDEGGVCSGRRALPTATTGALLVVACALLTSIAQALSWAGSGLRIIPSTILCFVILRRRGRQRDALTVALSSGGATLIFYVDKLLVGRPRPPVPQLEAATSASFPSGHATLPTAFYLALIVAFSAGRPPRRSAIAVTTAGALLLIGITISRLPGRTLPERRRRWHAARRDLALDGVLRAASSKRPREPLAAIQPGL